MKISPQPIEDDGYFDEYLIKTGHVEKINDEYYWTKEHFIRFIDSIIRLNRYIHSPYWRAYYKFSDFSKKKVRNFISAISYAWNPPSHSNRFF